MKQRRFFEFARMIVIVVVSAPIIAATPVSESYSGEPGRSPRATVRSASTHGR
jgi:hypothetical protein